MSGPYSPMDDGAVADGVTDCTLAFQRSLAKAAASLTSRKVLVPPGSFKFTADNLAIPNGVTLECSYGCPAGYGWEGNRPGISLTGTVLLVDVNSGNPDAPPFIQPGINSCLRGFALAHPAQSQSDPSPIPYPFSIGTVGEMDQNLNGVDGVLIENVHFVNSYQALSLRNAQRFIVRNVTGTALKTGILVDQVADTSWIDQVFFTPNFWTDRPLDTDAGNVFTASPFAMWSQRNGTGFKFLRADDLHVRNCHSFGMNRGYHFGRSPVDGMGTNGTFHGLHCETAMDAGIFLEWSGAGGQTFGHTHLFALATGCVGIKVAPTFDGRARFAEGRMLLGSDVVPIAVGGGDVIFGDWHIDDSNLDYSVQVTGGDVTIHHCKFGKPNRHVSFGAGSFGMVGGCAGVNGGKLDLLIQAGANVIRSGNR